MIVILHKTTSCDHEIRGIDAEAKRIQLGFIHIDPARCRGCLPRRATHFWEGAAVRRSQRYLSLGLALTFAPVGVISASPASADCTNAGGATVCAQGEVRGGGPSPPSAGYYPSYCADPWYCDDGWDVDVVLPPIDIGRPGRPGGGGGIGPRR
jgi:hypothetical protein